MNEAPRGLTKRQLLIGLAFAAASLGALYIVLPNLAAFGMTANLLLLPGSIGCVEGGMIGVSHVPGGLAIVAVLSYRAYSFWLPTIPGALAYISILRHEPATESAEAARA